MDYRGASKDGTYGSKNRNQSHWLKAAWPEKRERERVPGPLAAGCWRAELPGPSMSTCLPLPPPDSRLSLSLFLISLSPLLYVSSSFSFFHFSLSRGFVHLLQGGGRRAHALAAATFILGPCTKPIRSEESFHANSSENAFVVRRSGALVPNSFPRQNRDASTGRK